MRTTYHLVTYGHEDELLDKVCAFLGAPISTSIITHSSTSPERKVDTIVELSKYELLYVRLTVKLEDIIEVGDTTINEQPA